MRKWQDELLKLCRERGFIVTATAKRRRWLPGINAADRETRGGCERKAINSTCQGTAADVLKWAMLRIEEAIAGAGLGKDCKLCMSVRHLHCVRA